MLRVIRNTSELDVRRLRQIYFNDSADSCEAAYDMLDYIRSMLLTDKDSIFAVWEIEGHWVAALRVEGYRDGVLITALKTMPSEQGKGYATNLINAVLEQLSFRSVYAHIFNNNPASIAVHQKCGFRKIKDYAVFLDGGVSTEACTYVFCHA